MPTLHLLTRDVDTMSAPPQGSWQPHEQNTRGARANKVRFRSSIIRAGLGRKRMINCFDGLSALWHIRDFDTTF